MSNLSTYIKEIQGYESQVAMVATKSMPPERFIRIMQTALRKNPKLAECDKGSLFGSMLLAAQMGLEPNSPTQQCFLIPYKNFKTRTTECQFQLGYKGLMELVRRSGQVLDIYAETVHENDHFELTLGLERGITHKPQLKGSRGKVSLVYAVAEICVGQQRSKAFAWMTAEDIERIRMTSPLERKAVKDGYSTIWTDHWEEMAKKTVIKRLCKTLPLSMEDMRMIQTDGAIKRNHLATDLIEEQPDEMPESENDVQVTVSAPATSTPPDKTKTESTPPKSDEPDEREETMADIVMQAATPPAEQTETKEFD